MVTIDPDKTIQSLTNPKPVRHRDTASTGSFDAIYRQAMQRPENGAASVAPTSGTADIRPAQFDRQVRPSADVIVEQVQDLIDTMAAYQEKLGDGSVTLREIHPLMERMRSQAAALSAASGEAGPDARLSAIVNQSLTLSSMEAGRFHSGAYNDA